MPSPARSISTRGAGCGSICCKYAGDPGFGVAMHDDHGWSGPQGASLVRSMVRSMASSADGSTWFGTESGLARFDGSAWSGELPFGSPRSPISSVSIGPDGSVWVVMSVGAGVARIAVLRGAIWQELDIPSDLQAFGGWALVGAAGDSAVFASDGGLLRFTGEDWTRIWPEASPADPGWVLTLAAVSAEDVLAGSGYGGPGGIWRLRAGAWERDASPGSPDSPVRSLAFGPDGALWAAGETWVKTFRDGAWTSVPNAAESSVAYQIVPVADGTVWVAAGFGGVVALRPDGSTWRPDSLDRAPLGFVASIAVGPDGTIWAGSNVQWCTEGLDGQTDCDVTGLARFDGQTWTLEDPLGALPRGGAELRVNDLLVASDGSLWVAGEEWGGSARSFVSRFADGAWTVLLDTASQVMALAEHPDGSILAAGRGVWTFGAGEWTQELGDVTLEQLSVAPDGSVWVSGENPGGVVYRIP